MPKYLTAALLAVLLLFLAVILAGQPGVAPAEPDEQPQTEAAPVADTDAETESEEPEEPEKPSLKRRPPKEVIDDVKRIRDSLVEVMEKNPETVGWINVPDTTIDYPVVLGEDNDFYLDHSAELYYTEIGAIFEDYEDQREVMDNRNTVLYGHNVKWGAMFHDVEKFLEKEFFDKTPVYYYTMDNVYIFEPFSIFEASWEYQYFQIDFDDDAEFVAFCREMRDNSRFRCDVDFTADDHILTLSTCTNGAKTQRWCFQSRLVGIVELSKWRPPVERVRIIPGRERATSAQIFDR